MHFEVEINKSWLHFCDYNVANYEEALTSFMMNLKVSQDLITMLVEQLAWLK
jgi:hypothetical protein